MSFRLYSPQQENSIFIRRQAQTWRRSDLLTEAQLQAVYDLSDPQVHQTNLFFRILFFIFSLLCIGALVGLMAWCMDRKEPTGLALLIIVSGGLSLAAAQYLVQKYRFYRYGIEEALAAGGMILCVTGFLIFFDDFHLGRRVISVMTCLLFSVTACLIYLRFGYLYMAVISMVALCAIPFQLSFSHTAERLIVLAVLCAVFGFRLYRDAAAVHDFKKDGNTVFLACLLAGIYLTVNLHVFGVIGEFGGDIRSGHFHPESFPRALYWTSYILTFLMPAAVILGGLKSRRLILNAGLVMAVVSLATNKSYLGLTRNPWDPAILGAGMIALSLILTRWLNPGQESLRYGFTAREILKPEDRGVSLADTAAALTTAALAAHPPAQTQSSGGYTEGGSSGGGGAQRNI